VIKSDKTDIVILGLKRHHFKLDSLGEPTDDPDDNEAWSDICDSLRYMAQNLFDKGSKPIIRASDFTNQKKEESPEQYKQKVQEQHTNFIKNEISNAAKGNGGFTGVKSSRGKNVFWDID
jgi:hypothetical protein